MKCHNKKRKGRNYFSNNSNKLQMECYEPILMIINSLPKNDTNLVEMKRE